MTHKHSSGDDSTRRWQSTKSYAHEEPLVPKGVLLASAPTHHRLIVDLDNLVADIDLAAPMARALKLDSANNVYSGVGRVDLHAL